MWRLAPSTPAPALYHYENGKLVQVGKSVDMLNTAANRVKCVGLDRSA